jgi:hypothetical protein
MYSMAIIVCGMYLVLGARFAPRFTVIFLALIPIFYSLAEEYSRPPPGICRRRDTEGIMR